MGTGEYYFKETLLDIGGIIPLRFELYYGSGTDSKRYSDGLTTRFSGNHRVILEHQTLANTIVIEPGLGREISFKKNGDKWTVGEESRSRHQLVEKGDYYYCLDAETSRVMIFRKNGISGDVQTARLICILDRNNNRVFYEYSNDSDIPGPIKINDGFGRELSFFYEELGTDSKKWYLTVIKDQNGRRVKIVYEDQPPDHPKGIVLRSITDPSGAVQSYAYNTNNTECITRMTRPLGNIPYIQEYNTNYTNRGVVASQADALGNITKIQALVFSPYVMETTHFSLTHPDGTKRVFEHSHYGRVLKSIVDEAKNRIKLGGSNQRDQIEEVYSRMGDLSKISYHVDSGKISAVTNAMGNGMECLYDFQDQEFENPLKPGEKVVFRFYHLTQLLRANRSTEKLSYDSRGNLTNRIDASGFSTRYEYDSKGQCTIIINPLGGKRLLSYNLDGTLAMMSDSETAPVTFTYDDHKRLKSIQRSDGSQISYAYDLNNRMVAVTNENGAVYSMQYDLNGNLMKETDPIGRLTQYYYDAMDRLICISNQWGGTFRYGYNSRGMLSLLTDADGVVSKLFYDACGWQTVIQKGDHQWQTQYDREGQKIREISPMNRTTSMLRNQVGLFIAITNEVGAISYFHHDGQNRLMEKIDPSGAKTAFSYDARNLITAVSNSVIGQAAYQRDALGNIVQLKDPNGATWLFSYSAMGRLSARQDPMSNRWEYYYDNRGRLHKTVLPNGVEEVREYDTSGNMIKIKATDTREHHFGYDLMNRLTNATGLSLSYNTQGLIVNTLDQDVRFGADYSPAGRLLSVSYLGEQMVVKYLYNTNSGLLERIEDNLSGGWVEFKHNADSQVVQVRRSNGTVTSFDWDASGKLIRVQDFKGSNPVPWISINANLDPAGRVVRIQQTIPANPFASFTDQVRSYRVNPAGQISNPDWKYDLLGRVVESPSRKYGWDSASKLVFCNEVEYEWNGLGDLVSRKSGTAITRYFRNYAIANKPIVAEKDTGSGYLRYYIWSPSGQLQYCIDVKNGYQPSYYHFDRSGSTIAITDKDGQVSDAYAYTPFGTAVDHTGFSTQPFTYMGKWGVRQENTQGTLYQMGARFYDAQVARFLSPDPLWPNIIEPGELSPYQYARQDPIRYMDAGGLSPSPSNSGGRGDSGLPGSSRTKVGVSHGIGSEGDYWTDVVKNDLETKLVQKSASYDDKSKYGVYENDPYRKKQILDERNYAGKTDKSPGGMDIAVIVTDEGNSVGVLVKDENRKMTLQYYEIEKRKLEEGKPELPKSSGEVVRTDKSNSVADAFVEQVSSEFKELIGSQEQPAKTMSKTGNP